jgi:hypothetical protein
LHHSPGLNPSNTPCGTAFSTVEIKHFAPQLL